jgi:hypothetical protein
MKTSFSEAGLWSDAGAAAEAGLTAEWGEESLYGSKERLLTLDSLEAMLKDASLTVIARPGARTVADYLPRQIFP